MKKYNFLPQVLLGLLVLATYVLAGTIESVAGSVVFAMAGGIYTDSSAPISTTASPSLLPSIILGSPSKSVDSRSGAEFVPASMQGEVVCRW